MTDTVDVYLVLAAIAATGRAGYICNGTAGVNNDCKLAWWRANVDGGVKVSGACAWVNAARSDRFGTPYPRSLTVP